MAGKPKLMSLIKQLLRMHLKGDGYKTIARTLAISKNTVKRYISKVNEGRVPKKNLLALEDPELEAMFFSGNPAYRDLRYL